MEQANGSEGQWIADALERYFTKERWEQWVGTVASTVPDHFEACARILHRVNGNHPPKIRWAGVAASKGTVIHPEVQFHSMARARLYESVLLGGVDQGSPSHGELDLAHWAALVPVELIAAVVHSPELEAVEVTPATNLSSEADRLNRPYS